MATLQARIEALATAIGNYLRDNVVPRLLPTGGLTGQVLAKSSAADFAVAWLAPGADPWTYAILGATAETTGTANVDTALAFSPPPDSIVVFEGQLFLESAATTTGARPGLKWPTAGVLQNIGWVLSSSSATAFISRMFGTTITANAASTGIAVANKGFFGRIEGTLVTGPAVTGNMIVTIASEVSGSAARIMPNSWLRWRVL